MWWIVLSSITYFLPFLYPLYLWPLVFLFLIPIFLTALQKPFFFWHGFVWGILTFSLHLGGIGYALICMMEGPFVIRLLIPLCILVYLALYPGIWLWGTTQLQRIFRIQNIVCILFLWAITSWIYIMFIDRYCLWIFNRIEGYTLLHPLLPFVTHPSLLCLLPIVGKSIFTFLFCLVPASLTLAIHTTNKYSLIICISTFLPWIISAYIPITSHSPPWLSHIAYLPIMIPNTSDTAIAHTIRNECAYIVKQYPTVTTVILPESSIYISTLSPDITAYWNTNNLGRPIFIVAGAFNTLHNQLFNTCYWIYDGIIQGHFHKRHTMLFTEQLPQWCNCTFLNNLLFTTLKQRSPSGNDRPCIQLPQITLVPYLCSELFFNENPDDSYRHIPIVALCNDWWFECAYPRQIMYLGARFKALQWQRPILYITYHYACFFDIHGTAYPIANTNY